MRAVEVTIHNFRSIHEISVQMQDISVMAGANNSGKSNIVDAIRLFYADLKWDSDRDMPIVASSDSDSWVEIEFQPTESEIAGLKDEYKSEVGTFRVRNYFHAAPGPDGKARSGYYAYVNGKLSDTLFYGAKNVGSAKVGRIVYIPAVSKVDDHTKLTGPSALRDLVATVMSKVVASSPAYATLKSAFATFEGQIKTQQSEDGQSLEALEKEVTEEIASWESSFTLGIQSVQPDDILKTLIRPKLIDSTHGGEIDQLRFGAGFQRHLVYTLIRLAAKHSSAAPAQSGSKKEFSPQLTWILFEEPEAFLHPSQEEVLHYSLRDLVQDQTTQVLLTTHSSRFVSNTMDDLTRLIRLRRDSGVTTSYQVSREELDRLFDAALLADAEITPSLHEPARSAASAVMAALKTELWLQPQRSAAFFARRVLLVEGPSETGLYSYLVTRRLMSHPTPGVVVLDCMGKYNIHRFMSLFNAFGIDHSVMYDGDGGGARDAEVTKTITDASGSFTHGVCRLSGDIEGELGIPALPRDERSRKPQNILYHLEANLVDGAKLDAVILQLQSLCV